MTRHRSGEALVFSVATLLLIVHALDDAFVHRGPGLGLGQHALAGAISVAAAVAGVLAFPSLRPGLRAALAFSFGGLALANGMMHVLHIQAHGAAGGDVTGALAAAAGLVLVGLAVAIPWRHRGEGAAGRRRRWTTRVLLVPAGLMTLLFVLGPIGIGIVSTHKWREPVGDPPSAAYGDVRFEATDGLELAGWYRPSRNGAAVVVVHGGSSDRKGSVAHAEMLAQPRLRRAALRRPRARRERRHGEQLRLGLDQGHRRRARLPRSSARTSTRAGSARSASRPAPTR